MYMLSCIAFGVVRNAADPPMHRTFVALRSLRLASALAHPGMTGPWHIMSIALGSARAQNEDTDISSFYYCACGSL